MTTATTRFIVLLLLEGVPLAVLGPHHGVEDVAAHVQQAPAQRAQDDEDLQRFDNYYLFVSYA